MRLGEKTAAEISKIFAKSSINDDWVPKKNPFTEFFQHQRKPKSTSLDQSRNENQNVTSYDTEVFDLSDVLHLSHEVDRIPKMIGNDRVVNSTINKDGELENGRLSNNYIDNKNTEIQNKDNITVNESDGYRVDEEDQIAEESIVTLHSRSFNTNTSNANSFLNDSSELNSEKKAKFNVKEHNIDPDSHTWRPMKVDSSGDLKPSHSVLLHKDGKRTNITSSDSWIPNSGPVLKNRD